MGIRLLSENRPVPGERWSPSAEESRRLPSSCFVELCQEGNWAITVIKKRKHANLPLCPAGRCPLSLLSAVCGRLPKACRSLPGGPDSWFSTTA